MSDREFYLEEDFDEDIEDFDDEDEFYDGLDEEEIVEEGEELSDRDRGFLDVKPEGFKGGYYISLGHGFTLVITSMNMYITQRKMVYNARRKSHNMKDVRITGYYGNFRQLLQAFVKRGYEGFITPEALLDEFAQREEELLSIIDKYDHIISKLKFVKGKLVNE